MPWKRRNNALRIPGLIFLSMGGNLLRLIHSTPDSVRYSLKVVRTLPPPPGSLERMLAAELRNSAITHYKEFSDLDEAWSSGDDDLPKKPRHKAYIAAWDRFDEFWNGSVYRDPLQEDERGIRRYVLGPHHCLGNCCNHGDPEVQVRRGPLL